MAIGKVARRHQCLQPLERRRRDGSVGGKHRAKFVAGAADLGEAVPEDLGGAGGSIADLCVMVDEAAAALSSAL